MVDFFIILFIVVTLLWSEYEKSHSCDNGYIETDQLTNITSDDDNLKKVIQMLLKNNEIISNPYSMESAVNFWIVYIIDC